MGNPSAVVRNVSASPGDTGAVTVCTTPAHLRSPLTWAVIVYVPGRVTGNSTIVSMPANSVVLMSLPSSAVTCQLQVNDMDGTSYALPCTPTVTSGPASASAKAGGTVGRM